MPLIENICIGTKVHISISLTKQISTDCSADPHLGVKPIYSLLSSSNLSYSDYQRITFLWYKNVSSIRVVLIRKHLGCYRQSIKTKHI